MISMIVGENRARDPRTTDGAVGKNTTATTMPTPNDQTAIRVARTPRKNRTTAKTIGIAAATAGTAHLPRFPPWPGNAGGARLLHRP
ncbi:hypothetical protein GCM10009596_24120 [Arthrobacter rhombi]